MKNLLARSNRDVLEQFAWSNVLLAFDFDGTLAPIVDEPADATMRPGTRELLAEASRLYPTIVISGRAQPDVLKKLRGTTVREVIGNHGIEPWHSTDRLIAEVQSWLPVLNHRLASFKGLRVEDKIFSVAIHYRKSRAKKKARSAILKAAQSLGKVRVIGGKLVVNILPNGAPHKGIALTSARDRLGCDTAIYVGDDETDEDVFMLDSPGRLLSVRVGAKSSSGATYYLVNQHSVDRLMQILIELRREAAPRRQVSR